MSRQRDRDSGGVEKPKKSGKMIVTDDLMIAADKNKIVITHRDGSPFKPVDNLNLDLIGVASGKHSRQSTIRQDKDKQSSTLSKAGQSALDLR